MAILYFIYKLWIGLVFWLTLLLMYPFFYVLLLRRAWYPAAFHLKRAWSFLFQLLLFCPVRRRLSAALPPPPYIIVSNHSSYLDTVFMYSVIPDYFVFIGKGELLKWPLFRLFFRTMDIPVERGNSRLAYQALKSAYEAIDRGECVAMYPEGTIPDSAPVMKSFKNGAFKMAIDKQVPVVAITWQTTHCVLKDPSRLFSYSLPAVIRVVVHPAVLPPAAETELVSLRTDVFELIGSRLHPDIKEPAT